MLVEDPRPSRVQLPLDGSEGELALATAIGAAFIELQQLEFGVISYLELLAGGKVGAPAAFDVFASKTFGNLLREMKKHALLADLADHMEDTKKRRDFFVHRFLFHRYGGPLFTTDADYAELIRDAAEHGDLFFQARKEFDELMLRSAPVVMLGGKVDPESGEIVIVESEHAKARQS